jgi:PLP dependent protein
VADRVTFSGLEAAKVRDNLERARERITAAGGDLERVRICAATKYVPAEELPVLAEAGIEVVGENRAQDLEAKHAVYGDFFRWHFIGHLQSRKAKIVNRICELVHSLSSESAARRLEIPALVEVNLSGEETKSGVAEADLDSLLRACGDVRGLMTMPPETADPEASRPYFRRLRELAEPRGLSELSMGTSQDYVVAAEEGATLIRIGSALYRS